MIAIGCDHGGFELKNAIMKHLDSIGKEYMDVGCYSTDAVDYPIYSRKITEAVLKGSCEFGIIVCGTGIGVSIMANRMKGIRCALCHDVFSAKATREHNNANMLALGGRVVGAGIALEIVNAFLDTPFSGEERHKNRIKMLDA